MNSPGKSAAPARTPRHLTCSGPLAGVLGEELTRLQDHARAIATSLVEQGKPLTSPALEKVQQQIQTVQAGLEATNTSAMLQEMSGSSPSSPAQSRRPESWLDPKP